MARSRCVRDDQERRLAGRHRLPLELVPVAFAEVARSGLDGHRERISREAEVRGPAVLANPLEAELLADLPLDGVAAAAAASS